MQKRSAPDNAISRVRTISAISGGVSLMVESRLWVARRGWPVRGVGTTWKGFRQPDQLTDLPDFFLEWLAREFLPHLRFHDLWQFQFMLSQDLSQRDSVLQPKVASLRTAPGEPGNHEPAITGVNL
jgi:hypothetical protein